MTMLEAIKAFRSWRHVWGRDVQAAGDGVFLDLLTAAESEAKREAEAFERAMEAWKKRGDDAFRSFWNQDYETLDAYFATGEKEG